MASKGRPSQLSPEDLQEFHLRQMALQTARNQYLLVQEAHQAWVQRIGKQYRVHGQFDIDLQSGVLTARTEDRSNGHGADAEVPHA